MLQRFAFTSVVCVGLVFSPPDTLAEKATGPLNPSHAKPVSKDGVTGNFSVAFDYSLDAESAAALMPESGVDADRGADADDHWAGDGHDHGSELTGSLVKVKRVAELNDQVVPGINTTPGNLKALLSPGTIVHFWASWCGPCEEEFPQLERFYRTHISEELKAKGVRLITISNDFTAAPAARFIEKHGTTFPVYLDSEQTTNLAIVGQLALPATVMIDADGRFHRLAIGKLDWDFPRLPDILAATAARKRSAADGTDDQQNWEK